MKTFSIAITCCLLLSCASSEIEGECEVIDNGDGTATVDCPGGSVRVPVAAADVAAGDAGVDPSDAVEEPDTSDGAATDATADVDATTDADAEVDTWSEDAGDAGLDSRADITADAVADADGSVDSRRDAEVEPDGPEVDATTDARVDALDGGGDAAVDARRDGGVDAAVDARRDAEVDGEVDMAGDAVADGVADIGVDAASDGAADAEVVEERILFGSYTIRNSLDLEQISEFTRITGSLTVQIQHMPEVRIPNLETVDMGVTIQHVWGVTSISFDSLTRVGGGLAIQNQLAVVNHDLNHAGFPSLTEIGSRLTLVNFHGLLSLDFSQLRTVEDISIFGNNDLSELSFPALNSVSTDLYVGGHDSLVDIAAPNLTEVGRHFRLDYNDSLIRISFPELSRVGGDFYMTNNVQLPVCLVDRLIGQIMSRLGIDGSVYSAGREDCTCSEVDGETVASCP